VSKYPAAARGQVVEQHHGVAVPDPYRWLEDMQSPAARAFVEAENKLSDEHLGKIAVREALGKRILELLAYERVGLPSRSGKRYFWSFHDGRSPQTVIRSSATLDGDGTVVLDANDLSKDGSLVLAGFVPSDGKYFAYGVAKGAGDWKTWHIRDLTTGRDLPDELPYMKYYQPVFTRDGSGIYYSRFPAPQPGTELTATDHDCKVYFHKIGTPADKDVVVYERTDQPSWQFQLHCTADHKYLVIAIGDGEVGDRNQEQIAYLDLDKPGAKVVPLIDKYDAEYEFAGSDGPTFLFKTTLDAPNKRVIAIDLRKPARDQWKTIVAQDTVAIEDADVVGKHLFVSAIHDVHSEVVEYDLKGKKLRAVALPGLGTVRGFHGHGTDDKETFYVFTSFTTPATGYRFDLATGTSKAWHPPKVAFDPGMFESKQVFFASKDGTKVPMFITMKKDAPLDGKRPVMMTAYGFGGVPSLPFFDPTAVAWLERGGVTALVNIRGGGEYGEAWHNASKTVHRQTGFDDFIAAGEWLIANKYTSREHLGIVGASGGGMLVGAVLVQRPDLFGAAVPIAGVLDLLRFQLFGEGAGWQGDMGSPDNPEEFAFLYKISPLHNVKSAAYPPTLIITADTDVRVAPLHSYKFAAAMQHAQTGDAPILLRVETNSGHGGGGTLAQRVAQRADMMAFFAQHLGL